MNPPVRTAPDPLRAALRQIRRTPGISKPQVADALGIAPSAAHGLVERLVRQGIVEPSGVAASSGGRRATRYRIRAGGAMAVGVSVRIDRLELGVFDAALSPIARRVLPLPIAASGPETYLACVTDEARALLGESGVDRSALCGVGVSMPGPVDTDAGTVLQIAAAPLWRRVPVADRLSAALALPVRVDKDVYAGIRYLDMTGIADGDRCAAFLSIREGIGAALMTRGDVFYGAGGLAGEIGHLTVRDDGVPCCCGNTGCLELYGSDIGIVRQYNAQTGGATVRVDDVVALARSGDQTARSVFAQAVGYLVDATLTIIMNYDPDTLLIYCTWLAQQRALYFQMLDAFYARSAFTRRHTVDIRLLDPAPINLEAAATLAIEAYAGAGA